MIFFLCPPEMIGSNFSGKSRKRIAFRNMQPWANSVSSNHDANSHGLPRRDSRLLRSSELHSAMASAKKRISGQILMLYPWPGLTTPAPSSVSLSSS